MSAAFDTVDRRLLLYRLCNRFGFKGQVLKRFESYLRNKEQFGMIDSVKSDVKAKTFNSVFHRDRSLNRSCTGCTSHLGQYCKTSYGLEFHLYANNTQLYFAFRLSTAEQQSSLARIEACAGHIDSWLVQNKLKLNTEKTELLILNASYRPRPTIGTIQVSNVPLGTSESSMIKK